MALYNEKDYCLSALKHDCYYHNPELLTVQDAPKAIVPIVVNHQFQYQIHQALLLPGPRNCCHFTKISEERSGFFLLFLYIGCLLFPLFFFLFFSFFPQVKVGKLFLFIDFLCCKDQLIPTLDS